jgi:hypothetical protein
LIKKEGLLVDQLRGLEREVRRLSFVEAIIGLPSQTMSLFEEAEEAALPTFGRAEANS